MLLNTVKHGFKESVNIPKAIKMDKADNHFHGNS